MMAWYIWFSADATSHQDELFNLLMQFILLTYGTAPSHQCQKTFPHGNVMKKHMKYFPHSFYLSYYTIHSGKGRTIIKNPIPITILIFSAILLIILITLFLICVVILIILITILIISVVIPIILTLINYVVILITISILRLFALLLHSGTSSSSSGASLCSDWRGLDRLRYYNDDC